MNKYDYDLKHWKKHHKIESILVSIVFTIILLTFVFIKS